MYVLKPGIKQDPARRWALPDRIFFGHGACHILSGVFQQRFPDWGFWAVLIRPRDGFGGSHVFTTDGQIAFDYHGYSVLERLLAHHRKVSKSRFPEWRADVVRVDFPLLNTNELNARNMRGPDQYYGDPVVRAHRYLDRVDHVRLKSKVTKLL